ncbi:UNVERIFIED_CONTAM: hypothetical protein RMT77_005852 [Armadillidium vulgare]
MQEPGKGYFEIINGIKYVRPGGGFEAKGTLFQKINTNGKNESKIYTYLKNRCPHVYDYFNDELFYSPIKVSDVRWNFEKFLVGGDGKVYFRYAPRNFDPDSLKPDINFLLNKL